MSNYYNSMDREGQGISPTQAGFTTIISQDQLEQLKAKIRMGVSKVELGFSGTGKSFGEKISPEAYGKDERQDIRELAKLNKIELTTHAAFSGGPLSGLTQQGFSESARRDSIDEIKRAIDFAADVVEGGPVVTHIGEFQRPIFQAEGQNGDERKFIGYGSDKKDKDGFYVDENNEVNEAIVSLVNKEDGTLVNLRKNMTFDLPHYEEENGIIKLNEKSLPSIDKKNYEEYGIETQHLTWDQLKKKLVNLDNTPATDSDVAKFIYKNNVEEQISNINYKLNIEENQLKEYDRILRTKTYKDNDGNEQKIEEEELKNYEEKRKRTMSAIASELGQIKKMDRMKEQFDTIEDYGLDKTARSIADLGMYSREKQQTIESQREIKFERPLYVAPENIFPEQFGGHPQELKKIIEKGRSEMETRLRNKGFSPEQAKKEAKDHIKATFDIGHANTWKRYFQGSDEEFKKWFLNQIDDLRKNEIIGHVHVSDNFGYYDEHVVPGQGNVPIREALEILKEDKNVDFVIEAGREGDQAWIRGLKEVSRSPIYGLTRATPSDPWNLTQNSYFGKTAPPYFIIGAYAQSFGERSSKDFGSWSETSFE